MKITLDLSKLTEEGRITPFEAERLKSFAAHQTGSVAINVLVGFGVVAVSAGLVALAPTPLAAVLVGAAVFGLACVLRVIRWEQWELLAQICIVVGALIASAGALGLGEGSAASLLLVAVALAVASVVARSNVLVLAAVLAVGGSLGARTGYWHATYALAIYEPLLTIVLFSALALVSYQFSKRFDAEYERLSLTAARASVFMVNFGFWIGSLWGDRLLLARTLLSTNAKAVPTIAVVIPDWIFAIAWAFALVGVGIWGAMANRLWVINVAVVFAAIHFYTQWFERLGDSPASILLGGLILLGVAFGLWSFNRRVVPI